MTFQVAIEISKKYIKLGQVGLKGKTIEPLGFIVEPIESLTDEQATQSITIVLRNERLRAKSAQVVLSRDFVTVRNLHLPTQDQQEIAQMIDLHISRVVPFKKEEIIFSHQFLGMDEAGFARVLLAIVQIETLRRQVKILEKAGFFIDEISLSSYLIWQWVMKNYRTEINPRDLYLILDIDSSFTDFIIFSQQGLLFTRSIYIGASEIEDTQEVGLTRLIGEARQSLVIFYNEEINKKPARIFLSGARSIIKFAHLIESEFDIPVKLASIAYQLETKQGKSDIPEDVSLTALAGIILKEKAKTLPFVLPELQIRKAIRDKTRDLVILGSFLIYLFSITLVIFLGRIYNQQTYLRRLEERYTIIKQDLADLLDQSKKIDFIKNYLDSRRVPLFVISQLQKITPDEITVNFMALDENDNIILRGRAFQLSDVFKFVTSLEKKGTFKDVQTKYTRKRKMKDKEITEFELTLQLVP